MITRFAVAIIVLSTYVCAEDESPGPANFDVVARGETTPFHGDPDDVAIWPHPHHPAGSLIVATDESGSIQLYELDGTLRQDRPDGSMNDVDLRTNVDIGGAWGIATLIAASNQTDDSIALYSIDLGGRLLVPLAAIPSVIGKPRGLCLYRSPIDDLVYVLVDDEWGQVAQYELSASGTEPTLLHRRTVTLGGPLEGCVADDELGRLYVSERHFGIWRLSAEPDADDQPMSIAVVGVDDHLTAEVQGLTIYYAANQAGYLIASSQGTSTYAIYQRGGDNAFVSNFRIVTGGLDAAVGSDGIDVTNLPLGPLWSSGLFVAQDDLDQGFTRGFKLVAWEDVVAGSDVGLLLDTHHSRD